MTLHKTARGAALGAAVVAASFATTTEVMAGGHGIDLSGKTVEWVIPFSETGGSAKMGQLLCATLERGTSRETDGCCEIHAGCRIN